MFNAAHILIYWQAAIGITRDFPGKDSDPAPPDVPFKYQMLLYIGFTAMAIFYILDFLDARDRNQSQENRLAVLEDVMMDIRGRLLPLTGGCPTLDEDDDFKLPPPAYDIPGGFLED